MRFFRNFLLSGLAVACGHLAAFSAQAAPPSREILTPDIIADIRAFIEQDIVRLSVLNQNVKYKGFKEDDILKLDTQWVGEINSSAQPLISATLSNPLSAYLTRVQAHSNGLYTEIFVMDQWGLNVGQSSISSDYWQGDEAKFQKTYPLGGQAIFIDEPEYNEDSMSWNAQVNISIADELGGEAIGAATIEVNLTELQRRQAASRVEEPAAPETTGEINGAAAETPETSGIAGSSWDVNAANDNSFATE
ncbi:MAG: hypothetical protein WC989_09685 [Micavibrio sp.]